MISENKTQHLGTIYRLIEQFDVISRTDLAKLSGFAPASITSLTKSLIDHQFIMERAVQNSLSRGRPAVGLAISAQFWQLLCITLAPNQVDMALCELNGKIIFRANYPLDPNHYPTLALFLTQCIEHFTSQHPLENTRMLAISVSILGKINRSRDEITQLGQMPISCKIDRLQAQFSCPILLNEHFQLWLLTEATLGSLISNDNAIFLQLGETVNLSVLLRGELLHQQSKMTVDKMLMPALPLNHLAAPPNCAEIERNQLNHQITFPAIARLVDQLLPNRFRSPQAKIDFLCEQIEQQQPEALQILEHISTNLAYVLMNLINIFSSEKIMLSSPLIKIKPILFKQIQQKLRHHLLLDKLEIDLVTSQYEWHHPLIASSAIKQGIYEGTLIKNIIQDNKIR